MLRYMIVTLLALTGFIPGVNAQSKDTTENKRALDEKNFVFIAQRVNPQRGSGRQLTSQYDLTVNPDTVTAFLPYFGRAYSAPINPAEGGIKFTSTSFGYESVTKKKGRHEIVIRPSDASGIVSLRLTAFQNGQATLQVTQLNKEPISFTGYFVAGKDRPKKAF